MLQPVKMHAVYKTLTAQHEQGVAGQHELSVEGRISTHFQRYNIAKYKFQRYIPRFASTL